MIASIKRSLAALLLLVAMTSSHAAPAHTFVIGDKDFLLDGKPFVVRCGEMHFARIAPEYWRHRLQMAKAMGLNTVCAYLFWNFHEWNEGKFDWEGWQDVAQFCRIAQEEGLWVLVRPGPYSCAEWEMGGLPWWLVKQDDIHLRTTDPKFLEPAVRYFKEVARVLKPLQITHGGPVIMVQVENEYGSYGSDKDYLAINKQMFIDAGFNCQLSTCDPVPDVSKGSLPGLLPGVNGSSDPAKIKSLVRKNHDGKGPFLVAEWYPAWFDWWGEKHHTVAAEKYVTELDTLLGAGISINMYMFHGGTTRGFMNGANFNDHTPYQPQISSYDYDAPLDEAGNATDKFMQFRSVIQKHVKALLPPVPAAKKAIAIPSITLSSSADIFSVLPKAITSANPLTFEKLKQAYGYVLYRTKLSNAKSGVLQIKDLRDYAVVFVNGRKQGILDRMKNEDSLSIDVPGGTATIDILVENSGRINFGPYLLENNKGITEKVTLNGTGINGWQMYSLPMTTAPIAALGTKAKNTEAPQIKKGTFTLNDTGDTYLDMSSWGKGCVWINGHSLGRYWQKGPQQTLYIPVEWLKKGSNEIVVFEMIKPEQNELSSLDKPILNELK